MNMFRSRRKPKDQVQADGATQAEQQIAPAKTSRSLKRKQKNAPEPPPEFNLELALPSSNDFRTSLMLPGLSARFSMLREPNNPNTKIGKANDDSVLFPSRASRLNLFQHNPLTDIAEVDSIYSFRPPFTAADRSNSFSEGYASDGGKSIINRTKPGEGNNLFGGRQKLYKVPTSTSSTKDFSETPHGSLAGRHVYQSDVTASMFRVRSSAEHQSNENLDRENQPSLPGADADEMDNTNSPTAPFSKNRGTQSSTTSGPSNGRTSTAATSIASESPAVRQSSTSGINPLSRVSDQCNGSTERTGAQKRPYVQDVEHPPASLQTVDNILGDVVNSRAPGVGKKLNRLSQSRSATNLNQLGSSRSTLVATSSFRAGSPPPTQRLPLRSPMKHPRDVAAREDTRSPSPLYRAISPTAAHVDDGTFMTYNSSVQPGDRGKATALGLFNKPQKQYDEQQFSQRQLQMHEDRQPSSEQASRVASPEPINLAQDHAVRPQEFIKRPMPETPRAPVLETDNKQNGRITPVQVQGSSRTSGGTSQQRKPSSASAANPALVKARTESLIRRENAELIALEGMRNEAVPLPSFTNHTSQMSPAKTPVANGTFFNALDASDDDSDSEPFEQARESSQSRRLPSNVHPALRDGLNDFIFDETVTSPKLSLPRSPFEHSIPFADGTSAVSHEHPLYTPIPSPAVEKTADSPTLPLPGLGLSMGLVRTHMRHESDKSSLYPMPSPDLSQVGFHETSRKVSTASTERTINPPGSIRSDPWELDNVTDDNESPRNGSETLDPTSAMAQRAQQLLGQAAAMKNQSTSKAQRLLGEEAPDAAAVDFSALPQSEEMKHSHKRDDSSLTQKERQEWDDEAADRRRKIQQSLKGLSDQKGRSRSPAPQSRRSPNKSLHTAGYPFPDQRPDHFLPDGQFEQPPKAMKMLGIQEPPRRKASPRIPQDMWREEEERMLQDFGRRHKQRSPPAEEDDRPRPDRPIHPGPIHDVSAEQVDRSRQRSATQNSGRPPTGRARGFSEVGNRSRSRTGMRRENDDRGFARPMDGGSWGHATSRPPEESFYRAPSRGPGERAPSRGPTEPRSYERSASAASGRYHGNSRANAPGYVDNRPPPVIANGNGNMPFRPPRPAPQPMPSMESPMSPHPPQRAFDSSSSPTPSITNSPTVTAHALASTGHTTPTSNGRTTPSLGGRKKSVTKNMISEPTFLSTTYNVALVGLPPHETSHAGITNTNTADSSEGSSPPVPVMNPRRRHGTATAATSVAPPPSPFQFLRSDPRPMPRATRDIGAPMPESPDRLVFMIPKIRALSTEEHTVSDDNAIRTPKQRNRLRKTSSEGGSMAAKARNQAIMGELRGERIRSPAVPNFAVKQGIREGEMF